MNNFEYIDKLTSCEKSFRLFYIFFRRSHKWLLIKANGTWRTESYKIVDIIIDSICIDDFDFIVDVQNKVATTATTTSAKNC